MASAAGSNKGQVANVEVHYAQAHYPSPGRRPDARGVCGCVSVPSRAGGVSSRLRERIWTGRGHAGLPDIGILSLREQITCVQANANAVAISVMADGDTGFGNAVNTAWRQPTTGTFARAQRMGPVTPAARPWALISLQCALVAASPPPDATNRRVVSA